MRAGARADEGARGDWRNAHFGKFVPLLDDYLATRAAEPGFQPALPVGAERPGMLAGPAFEIVQPSFYVLPHRRAAWRILAERLDELAGRAERLSGTAELGQLAELATDLRGMAHDVKTA